MHWKQLQDYRDLARWGALLPSVSVRGVYNPSRDGMKVRAFPYYNLPFLYHNRIRDVTFRVELRAMWDLGRLIFERRELPHFGRVDRNLRWEREDLTERVHRLYSEYRTLARKRVFGPAREPLVAELELIRLQEISAMLDHISHGFWGKATGGVWKDD